MILLDAPAREPAAFRARHRGSRVQDDGAHRGLHLIEPLQDAAAQRDGCAWAGRLTSSMIASGADQQEGLLLLEAQRLIFHAMTGVIEEGQLVKAGRWPWP